jgi:conjugative relaxase-like TrwC/TraI family protein
MLRIRHKTDAQAVKDYMRQSDYYLETPGDWMGKGGERLGLTGRAAQADFEALCDNLRPDGSRLTAMTVEGRRVGYDFNFNSSKSVGIAREIIGHYDPAEGQRIEDAHREAVAYAMGYVERDMAVRVRAGGKNEDEITGNMIAMRVTHRTTRPNEDDYTPDMSLHDHVFVINASFGKDGKAKAAQMERIVHDAPYYEALYHNRLAASLQAMGYGIRRKGKGFELAGISDATIDTFSRRRDAIEKLADTLGITSDKAKDKLGATSRLRKEDSRLVELVPYWLGKLSDDEREGIRDLRGHNSYRGDVESAMRYAIGHEFYRNSVVEARKLYETAIRHGIGSVTPEDIEAEAKRQGVLFQGNEVSTQAVLDQEQRVIGFAREGKGTFQPLAADRHDGLAGLSAEQAAAVRHVWQSRDALMLVRGAPGAGKTTMMTPALSRLGVPAVLLAPSSDASRGKLREDGFKDANTVAAFLGDAAMQQKARHGIIWVDEASLLPVDDLEEICGLAKDLGARVVLQGDPKQHKSPRRHGNMLTVLEEYAGLPVAEINKIQRQKGEYADAVEAIRAGEYGKGVDTLARLGWIVEGEGHDKLAEHYARDLEAHQAGRAPKPLIIVNPTHKDGDALTERLRGLRKAAGLVTGEERTFAQWTGLNWTPAQQGDAARYAGDEVVQFFRNSGQFKAGDRVTARELLPHLGKVNAGYFGVFKAGELKLSVGDVIRITNNGRDATGKHRVDNGRIDTVAGFTRGGDIKLSNGWVIGKDFAHMKHGLVSTSPAAQSKDKTRAWQQLNRASLGAAGAEQFLVSLSRGKEQGLVFTDLPREELVAAIKRADNRKSATEVFRPRPLPAAAASADRMRAFMEKVRRSTRPARAPAAAWSADRMWQFMEKVRRTYRQLRRRPAPAHTPAPTRGGGQGWRGREQSRRKGIEHGR